MSTYLLSNILLKYNLFSADLVSNYKLMVRAEIMNFAPVDLLDLLKLYYS